MRRQCIELDVESNQWNDVTKNHAPTHPPTLSPNGRTSRHIWHRRVCMHKHSTDTGTERGYQSVSVQFLLFLFSILTKIIPIFFVGLQILNALKWVDRRWRIRNGPMDSWQVPYCRRARVKCLSSSPTRPAADRTWPALWSIVSRCYAIHRRRVDPCARRHVILFRRTCSFNIINELNLQNFMRINLKTIVPNCRNKIAF
jgi:hypothetical protein